MSTLQEAYDAVDTNPKVKAWHPLWPSFYMELIDSCGTAIMNGAKRTFAFEVDRSTMTGWRIDCPEPEYEDCAVVEGNDKENADPAYARLEFFWKGAWRCLDVAPRYAAWLGNMFEGEEETANTFLMFRDDIGRLYSHSRKGRVAVHPKFIRMKT